MKKTLLSIAMFIIIGYTASATTFTVTNSGFTFTPDAIQIQTTDIVVFSIANMHNVIEVSEATWNSNGNTSNGGFTLPLGGGTLSNLSMGMHYYVCGPHASLGMKGTIEVLSTVGIKESTSATGISIYPNPFTSLLHIDFTAADPARDLVEVFDITGQSVYKSSSDQKAGENNLQVDMAEKPDGIYFVSAFLNGERRVEKIIKQ